MKFSRLGKGEWEEELRDLQVNNVPGNDQASARTVTVKERSWTGTKFAVACL
ncbi:MAG: hypothetical protein F6J93_35130 [Oscillatoria sp. SIO1A7]|nr:hypothetical protein [Oscillatoria sp. SIO1A7]